jgi:hypothetical protein
MKISDLEDADRIPTRDYISAGLADLKADLLKVMLDQQKSMADFQGRVYQMIIGTYALIILGIFVNHFWR